MQERQLKFGASSLSAVVLSGFSRSLWPALKRGDGEERQHPHQHVVKVKVAVLPNSLPHHWMVHITIFEHHKRAPKQSHTQVLENNPVSHCESKSNDQTTYLHSSGVCLASSVHL